MTRLRCGNHAGRTAEVESTPRGGRVRSPRRRATAFQPMDFARWLRELGLGPGDPEMAIAPQRLSPAFQAAYGRAVDERLPIRLARLDTQDKSYGEVARQLPTPSLHGWLHDGGLWISADQRYRAWLSPDGHGGLSDPAMLYLRRDHGTLAATLFARSGEAARAFFDRNFEDICSWSAPNTRDSFRLQLCTCFDDANASDWWAAQMGSAPRWFGSPNLVPLSEEQQIGRRDRNRLVIDEDQLMLFIGPGAKRCSQLVMMLRELRTRRSLDIEGYKDILQLDDHVNVRKHMSTRVSQLRGRGGFVGQLEQQTYGSIGPVFESIKENAFVDLVDDKVVLKLMRVNMNPDADRITFVSSALKDDQTSQRELFEEAAEILDAALKCEPADRDLNQLRAGLNIVKSIARQPDSPDVERLRLVFVAAFLLLISIWEGQHNVGDRREWLRQLLTVAPADLPWRKEFQKCLHH